MIKGKDRIYLLYLLITFMAIGIAVKVGENTSNPLFYRGILNLNEILSEKNKIVELDGEWEYYKNKFILPKDIPFFSKDKDFFLLKNIEKNNSGTYCLEINIENTEAIYGIVVPPVYGNYEIYFNGKKIADNGVLSFQDSMFSSEFNTKYIPLKTESKKNYLIIYLSNDLYKIGGLKEYIKIGEYTKLLEEREKTKIVFSLLAWSLILFTIYNIGLYYFRRKNKESIYFILLSILFLLIFFIKLETNIEKTAYFVFRIEIFLKILISIIIINGKYLEEKEKRIKDNIKYKLFIFFCFIFFFYKIESVVPQNIIYSITNFICAIIFSIGIIKLNKKNSNKTDVFLLKNAYFVAILVLVYSGILEAYNKTVNIEIFLLIFLVVVEYTLLIKKNIKEYVKNNMISKELDISKEKLEKIVFYKSRIMEKEKLKWDNFIKYFKEMAILADEEGNIVEWNPALLKILEILESDIIGKKIWDLEFRYTIEEEKTLHNYQRIKNIYMELLEPNIYSLRENNEVIKIETEDGTVKKIEVTRFLIPLNNLKMLGFVGKEIE